MNTRSLIFAACVAVPLALSAQDTAPSASPSPSRAKGGDETQRPMEVTIPLADPALLDVAAQSGETPNTFDSAIKAAPAEGAAASGAGSAEDGKGSTGAILAIAGVVLALCAGAWAYLHHLYWDNVFEKSWVFPEEPVKERFGAASSGGHGAAVTFGTAADPSAPATTDIEE